MDGYPCARYKKLRTLEEAEAWIQHSVPYPIKQNIKPGRVSPSSSSSTVKLATSGRSKSESQTVPGPSSTRLRAAAWPSIISASAEDVVYTDGACSGNGQHGSVAGIGVWWGVDDPRYVLFSAMPLSAYTYLTCRSNLSERCPGLQTNNRAELLVRLILHKLSVSSDAW